MSAAPASASPPGGTTAGSRRGYLTKLTVVSTLGGLLFGYDTGVISGALLYMRDDLALTGLGEATVVSSLLFPGAAVGALLGGRLSDALGRKGSLLVCAVLFIVGALGCAVAPNVEMMVLARIVLGFGVGAAAVTVPLYLAEMAPVHRRGRMVTINESPLAGKPRSRNVVAAAWLSCNLVRPAPPAAVARTARSRNEPLLIAGRAGGRPAGAAGLRRSAPGSAPATAGA